MSKNKIYCNLTFIKFFLLQIFLFFVFIPTYSQIAISSFSDIFIKNVELNIPTFYNIIAGQKASIPIQIKNLESKEIKVFLNVFPPYYEGISAYFEKNEIIVKPNSEVTTHLIVTTPIDTKDKIVTYQIYVNVDGIEKVYRLNLNVIGIRGEIKIENFGINKISFDPEEELKIFIEFKNTKDYSTSIKIKTEILRENELIDSYERYLNILRHSLSNFTFEYKFTYYHKPGRYLINIYSFDGKDNLISKLTFEVNLKEIRDIKKEVIKEQSFWFYRVNLFIKNIGNVKQTLTLEEEFPLIIRPFVVFENIEPIIFDGKAIWNVTLDPLEEIVISYSIVYWIPISIISLLTTLIFFYFLLGIIFPKINKRYEKSEDIYKIKIIIKNTTTKRMKNIEITDFVPLLFTIQNFETLRPQIKKTKEGYTLTWKIRELRPKEEVIISYSIKPVIEIIGELKFPKPKVKYVLR
ncbi:MAG: hypothetical protein QXW35_02280 [Candidatus Aenigmatarchaeota archaeon]